jgi:hypothetical protein
VIIRPDSKGRISLGSISENVSSYEVTVEGNGTITLKPFTEIPLSDKWIFEDKDILEKFKIHFQDERAKQHS